MKKRITIAVLTLIATIMFTAFGCVKNDENPHINIIQQTLEIEVDQTSTLTASVSGSEETKVVWTSSDTTVVTVTQGGVVKGKAVGTATVTAKIKGTSVSTQCTVTVVEKVQQPQDPQPPQEPQTPHVHTFDDEWQKDQNNHWHLATCEDGIEDGIVGSFGLHNFNGNTCTICNYEKQEVEEVCQHKYNQINTNICQVGKLTKNTCSLCGDEYYTLDENGNYNHNYQLTRTNKQCGVGITTIYTCTACDNVKVEYDTSDSAKSHNYQNIDTKKQCEFGIIDTYTCSLCGVTKTEIDESESAKSHEYKVINSQKKCGEGITTNYKCELCDNEKTETDISESAKACQYVNGQCSLCGDIVEGALLYSQNFENLNDGIASDNLISALGWRGDSKKYGAYQDSTANLSIANLNAGKVLYVNNNISGGKDSYFEILSKEQFGTFHMRNFTYQYDLMYADASGTGCYIAMVSDYDGGSYMSFHLRNRGTANHEVHCDDKWISVGDGNVGKTDSNSIATKILGKAYDASVSAFKDVSISIRYVVDWQNGNRVYMRVNDTAYQNSGEWILVSQTSASFTATYNQNSYGKGFALKVGRGQNGYIDNIYVWTGTEVNIPTDLSEKTLISDNSCSGHKQYGDSCEYCGKLMAEREYRSYEIMDEFFSKDTDQKISASAERIKLIDGLGDYYVPQGGCTDGKYVYFGFENQKLGVDGSILSGSDHNKVDHYVKVVKIDIDTWEIVKISEPLVLNHCNDMTYVPSLKQLIVLNNAPNGKLFSYVDVESLTIVKTALSTDLTGYDLDNHYAIGYCPEKDQFAIGKSGTYDTIVLRGDYSLHSMLYCPNPTGYTKQGLDCDEKYIYYVQYKTNVIMVYDWAGNFISCITLDNVKMEPEFIYHIGDDFYIGAYNDRGCSIYKVTLNG